MCCVVIALSQPVELRAGQDNAAKRATLHYTVSIESPESQRVAVTVSLTGIEPGRNTLRWVMPQRFAFVRLPEPLIEGSIRATADGKPLEVQRAEPYLWDVTLAGQTAVTLSYIVPLTHRTLDAVKNRDAYEYPYLAKDHGLLVSPTLFVFPEDAEPGDIRVRFELPTSWRVVAPWRSLGKHEFDPGGRKALLNDLIAVGAWHIHEIRVGSFEGTIAIAPGQDALEQAAVEPMRRIITHELELFDRLPMERYLFIFGRPDISGLAGSPKTGSMTLNVEPRLAARASRYLPHLIGHEFFHTWLTGVEMPDELRWFNEGFTDYYAYLVAARVEFITWQDFADTLADKMLSCALNPMREHLSLSKAGGDVFFTNRHAHDLVYDGGMLVGAWLDRAVRAQKKGKTLDDLMRAFNNDPRWHKDGLSPTAKDLVAVARRFTDETTAARLEHYANQPFDFDPVAAFAETDVKIRHVAKPPKMALRANLDGTRVIDLDRHWITYRVGVRADDRLIEINGQPVSDAQQVRAAWRKPVDNRIRVTLLRDEKEVKIDEPLPLIQTFTVPADPWRRHK